MIRPKWVIVWLAFAVPAFVGGYLYGLAAFS